MIRIDGRLPLTLTAIALAVTADLYVRAQSSPAAAAPPQTAGTNAEARVTGLKTQAAAGVEEPRGTPEMARRSRRGGKPVATRRACTV